MADTRTHDVSQPQSGCRFLHHAETAFENNFAERQTRPAVVLLKNSQSNRSDCEPAAWTVLMSPTARCVFAARSTAGES